jgi:DNA (cytosine-5)-methyltransferase 1
MNVLSLFDGMSCGQQALERNGIKVDNYFASEIDKYAITVTMANYPNTKQLGSVVDVDGYSLPKIDLLMGGSPCQSFSFAGKRKGMSTKDEQEILTLEHYLELKNEGFEFEGQSYLFWEYMRLLNECKPKYFLLENVEMGERWEKVLSKAIGVNGIHINSSLVSAQNRKRIYWTNIGLEPAGLFGYPQSTIEQPKDKGILLKDVLESEVDEKYYLSEKMVNYVSKTGTKNFYYKPEFANLEGKAKPIVTKHIYRAGTTNYIKENVDEKYYVKVEGNKRLMQTLSNNKIEDDCLIDSYNKTIHLDKSITISTRVSASSCTHVYKESIINSVEIAQRIVGQRSEDVLHTENEKMHTLCSLNGGKVRGKGLFVNSRIRKLTPIECERLQTVKDNYTNFVSDSQRYKMIGNGWTIDVICHILNYIKQ